MHPVHNCRHIKSCPKQSCQTIHCLAIAALYAKNDENLTDDPNSSAIIAYICLRLHLANPLPLCDRFLRLSFVFYEKIIKKTHKCDECVSIDVIDQVRSAKDDPNALLQINR